MSVLRDEAWISVLISRWLRRCIMFVFMRSRHVRIFDHGHCGAGSFDH